MTRVTGSNTDEVNGIVESGEHTVKLEWSDGKVKTIAIDLSPGDTYKLIEKR